MSGDDSFWQAVDIQVEKHGAASFYFTNDATPTNPAVAYTAGLAGWPHPELIVFSLEVNAAAGLIRSLVDLVLAGEPPALDTPIINAGLSRPVVLKPANVDLARPWMKTAAEWARRKGHDFQAAQILVCDSEGRFPGERGCDRETADLQPLLFRRR